MFLFLQEKKIADGKQNGARGIEKERERECVCMLNESPRVVVYSHRDPVAETWASVVRTNASVPSAYWTETLLDRAHLGRVFYLLKMEMQAMSSSTSSLTFDGHCRQLRTARTRLQSGECIGARQLVKGGDGVVRVWTGIVLGEKNRVGMKTSSEGVGRKGHFRRLIAQGWLGSVVQWRWPDGLAAEIDFRRVGIGMGEPLFLPAGARTTIYETSAS